MHPSAWKGISRNFACRGLSEVGCVGSPRVTDRLIVASISTGRGLDRWGGRVPPDALDRAYAGFLELPVPVVLAVLWVAGAALEVAGVVTLYEVGWVLVRLAGGHP